MRKKTPGKPYRLLQNSRFWILCFSGLLSGLVLVWVVALVAPGELRIIRVQQSYGFISLVFLYIALMATPVSKLFPNIKIKENYLHARRAFGVSAFLFGLLHASLAFFGQLGGFSGLSFLSGKYQLALALGAFSLAVLSVMALTSFDKVIDRMGFPRWKKLHQLVYFAGFAILLHLLMLGTHYAYGGSIAARITVALLIILFVLELVRLQQKYKPKFEVPATIMLCLIFLGTGFLYGVGKPTISNLAVHGSEHTEAHSHGEQYTGFEPVTEINGRTIRISNKQLSRTSLISGSDLIRFSISPSISNLTSSECFMVNQQNFTYIQGFTKNSPAQIDCLPIGDVNPPQPGDYTIYLRLTYDESSVTTPFNLEITP